MRNPFSLLILCFLTTSPRNNGLELSPASRGRLLFSPVRFCTRISASAQGSPTSAATPSSPPTPQQNIASDTPPPPVPPSDRLTLRQAVQIGMQQNPQTMAARYAVQSARENYNSQKSPINPTLQYAALNNSVAPADIASGFALRSNYVAYVTLETNGALRYRTAQAREQYHQAQFDASTTRLSLALNIINAYVGLQVANRALEVEQRVYDNMRQLSDLTQKRFENGAGTEADARRARIAYVQELQNVITDVANVNNARATLNAQLGHSLDTPIDTAEPLVYSPAPLQDLAELTKRAEQRRPELQSARANLFSLRAVPGLERSAYYPDVVVGRDFGKDSQINVGLSVPLDLGSIHGAVAKAKADAKSQEAQVELERQNIDLDVKSSYNNVVAARKQVDTFETGIVKESETLLEQIRQAYSLGANTILDIITAENTYRSVQSAYYSAIGAYVQALYALEHASGNLQDTMPGVLDPTLRMNRPTTSGGQKTP